MRSSTAGAARVPPRPGLAARAVRADRDRRPFLVYDDERWTFAAGLAGRGAHRPRARGRRTACARATASPSRCATTPSGSWPSPPSPSVGAVAVAHERAGGRPTSWPTALATAVRVVLFADAERLERLARCRPRRAAGAGGARRRVDPGARALARRLDAAVGDVPMPPATIAPDDAGDDPLHVGLDRPPEGRAVSTHRAVLSALLSWEARPRASRAASPASTPRDARRASRARCSRCRCSTSPASLASYPRSLPPAAARSCACTSGTPRPPPS